jgi:hypothetical protein
LREWLCDAAHHQAGHRTAQNAAHHETERRARDSGFGGRLQAVMFGEYLAPRGARAVSARQRDRTAQQAKQRIDAERIGEADAHSILQHQQADHDAEKTQQHWAALLEAREIGIQPDGREEGEHQGRLQGRVEAHLGLPATRTTSSTIATTRSPATGSGIV